MVAVIMFVIVSMAMVVMIMPVIVVMLVVVRGLQELRLDLQDAVEVEGVAPKHLGQWDPAALGGVQPGIRVENAIWFFASGASLSRSLSHLASATVTTASSLVLRPTFSSMKNVCATGAGSARPVVSTMMASNLPLRRIKPSMMRTRSPRTVQQMQPLFISNTSSSAPTTRSLSMPISPNSLTMTAYFCPCCSLKMRLSSVVLPAPR